MLSKLNVKNAKGFTLVEVIVVAVIVAVLAAVAIPLYLNYVTSSRVNAAANAGGSIASFCGACASSGGTLVTSALPDSLTCTNAATGNTKITVPSDIVVTVATATKTVTARHTNSDAGVAANTKSFQY